MKPSDVRLMKTQMVSVAETEEYQNEELASKYGVQEY